MTRAKEELYLSHARMRDFRGRSLYAVPSMFLEELPAEGIAHDDRSSGIAGPKTDHRIRDRAADDFDDQPLPTPPEPNGLAVGVIVDHASYGRGKVLDLSGMGALRRVKIRFGRHGEKVFVVEKAKLTVILDE
jgi:DNA helicase-2/ATP-dependent DNA helicase PcrA